MLATWRDRIPELLARRDGTAARRVPGDRAAASAFADAIYVELRSLARRAERRRGATSLQPTALFHEVWIKLEGKLDRFEGCRHCLCVAARAMRQLLATPAEARGRRKRHDRRVEIPILDGLPAPATKTYEALALEQALQKLGQLNERHARVVELRFFCSLTIPETAAVLGGSHTTFETD